LELPKFLAKSLHVKELFEKLTEAQLGENFPRLMKHERSIFTAPILSQINSLYLLKTPYNIILKSVPAPPKCSISFRLSD
jgi:hypothetical protein